MTLAGGPAGPPAPVEDVRVASRNARRLLARVHSTRASCCTDHARAAYGKMANIGVETVTRLKLVSERFELGRNFCNKLWNACRFLQMSWPAGDNSSATAILARIDASKFDADDHAILARLLTTTREVDRCFGAFEFSAATQALYGFFWNDFCDWYVEVSKSKLQAEDTKANCLAIQDLVLRQTLLLLNPVIPFITEELWALLGYCGPKGALIQDSVLDDASTCATALGVLGAKPDPAQAASVEQMKLFVGDLVEAVDVAEVFLGELLEPDVGALGHEDDVRHPGLVGGKVFVLVERGLVAVGIFLALELVVADELVADEAHGTPGGRAVPVLVGAGGMEAHPDGEVFFAEDVDGEQDSFEFVAEVGGPFFADEVELADEGVGRGEAGRAQSVEEAADLGRDGWARAEVVGKGGGDVRVDSLLLQAGVL